MNNKGAGGENTSMPPAPQGMPQPTQMMDMGQMNQFPNGMMMPN